MTREAQPPSGTQLELKSEKDAVSFAVRVSPRASRSKIMGVHDGALKVSLAAPPVDGEANAELCALLSKQLSVPKRCVTILQGERGKSKLVRVQGVSEAEVRQLVPADE